MKIILVEDDERLGKLIKEYLIHESEVFDIVKTGVNIAQQLEEKKYDILILDVMLPDRNGIDICRELRKNNVNISILFITALNNQIDKIKAFESGADDYLTKPFDFQELLVRIKALVRRENNIESPKLIWQNLIMMPEEKKVVYENKYLHLTPTEFKILQIFLETPNKVFNTENIIDKLWDIDTIPTNNTLRSHIKSLRKKLEQVGLDKEFIETVYGMGYRLKTPSITNQPTLENNSQTENKIISHKEEKLTLFMEEIWLDNQESVSNDCQTLLDYIQGKKDDISIDDIIRIPHNFVGFLGSIGFSYAGEIARNIEAFLKENKNNLKEEKVQLKITNLIYDLQKSLFPEAKLIFKKNNQLMGINYKVNILVIDEDQKLADELIFFIENPNIDLNFAYTINTAIKDINDYEYDLVILETQWKNKGDRQNLILDLLSQKQDKTKIIIYSKNDDLENRLYCSKYPINAFLSKNNSLEILWQNIENILGENNDNSQIKSLYDILIIDDDIRFTEVLKQKLILNQLPVNINIISDSETFLDEIKKIKPHLIILDLEMPKLNGLDICKIIKKDPFLQSIQVLFLTGNLAEDVITKFIEAGADDFISKSKIDVELYPRIITHLNRYKKS